MTEQPKFHSKNPQNREEKLIVELITLLDEITMVFIKSNFFGNMTHEQFVILRDASIGYAGKVVMDLSKMLANESQVMPFLNDAERIYLAYINHIKQDNKHEDNINLL